MLRVQVPVSFKEIKEVVAFDLEEEIALFKYIAMTERLIKSNKCNYDNDTIRNLIICGLFTGTRIGELGSIDYTKHIDFKNKNLIVTTTLTKDKNGHVILGDETKTGRYKRLKGKKDIRYISETKKLLVVDNHLIPYEFIKNVLLTDKKIIIDDVEGL